MLSLYEILKASKTGLAPDMWTALAGMNWGGADSGHEVKELTGIPPLSFTADGTPLLDYLISGNMSQTGTPTPSNPVDVNGVGVRTENLLNYHYLFTSDYDRHSTYFDYYKLILEPSTQYTFTTNATSTNDATTFLVGTANVMSTSNDGLFNGVAKTITSNPDGSIYIARRIAKLTSLPILPESDFDNGVYYIMLNTGSTAIPYEPYGYKIPISSGGVTTNIYLSSTQTVRAIKKVVFDGTEQGWGKNTGLTNSNAYVISLPNWVGNRKIGYCTHYENVTSAEATEGAYFGNSLNILTALADGLDNVTKFKNWLAEQYANGTPVTVWYALATAETAAVNEPLMKIGTYADTISMTDTGIVIPTVRGNNVLTVDTTVQPSEVYIKYKNRR